MDDALFDHLDGIIASAETISSMVGTLIRVAEKLDGEPEPTNVQLLKNILRDGVLFIAAECKTIDEHVGALEKDGDA